MAQMLEARTREHLKLRNNLFAEGGSGLSASLARPLLVLFDRNFELSVVCLIITGSAATGHWGRGAMASSTCSCCHVPGQGTSSYMWILDSKAVSLPCMAPAGAV